VLSRTVLAQLVALGRVAPRRPRPAAPLDTTRGGNNIHYPRRHALADGSGAHHAAPAPTGSGSGAHAQRGAPGFEDPQRSRSALARAAAIRAAEGPPGEKEMKAALQDSPAQYTARSARMAKRGSERISQLTESPPQHHTAKKEQCHSQKRVRQHNSPAPR